MSSNLSLRTAPQQAGGERLNDGVPTRAAILRRVAIHDRYQLELKLGYPVRPNQETVYRIDTYIFAPHSLAINAQTYPRADFYADIQTYIRMKTPSLGLKRLAADPRSPLLRCEQLLAAAGSGPLTPQAATHLRDNLRILRVVLKSALQRVLGPLLRGPQPDTPDRSTDCAAIYAQRVDLLIDATDDITARLRALEPQLASLVTTDGADPARLRALEPQPAALVTTDGADPDLLRTFHLTDESISLLVEDVLLRAHQLAATWLESPAQAYWQARLVRQAQAQIDYRRRRGYPSVLDPETGETYMRRLSALKKFTSSVLWLDTDTRREGTTLEQVLLASAAGVSMIFATVIAFYVQAVYGQVSLPLFLALVVAYMFKDRIKDLGKAFSAHLLARHTFDYRTTIQLPREHVPNGAAAEDPPAHPPARVKLGYIREKMAHCPPDTLPDSLPEPVRLARYAGPYEEIEPTGAPESVIHYVKEVRLQRDAFRHLSLDGLEITAINDITRLDVRRFLRKMDNPTEDRLVLDRGHVKPARLQRTYHLNLVSQFVAANGETTVERTLIVVGRKGIHRIEQFTAQGTPANPTPDPLASLDDLA